MTHPADSLHLKVALTSLFILAALTAYSTIEPLNCWIPAYFTHSHASFTLSTCKNNMSELLKEGWDYPPLYFNLLIETVGSVTIYLLCCHVAAFTKADSDILAVAWRQAAPSAGDRIKELLSSYFISTFYFFTQLISLGFWLSAFFFARDFPETLIRPSQDISDEGKFLCHFTVMQMGDTHPHTVLCELPTYDNLRLAIFGNNVMCLVMPGIIGLHIVSTFLFAPLPQRGNALLAAKATKAHSIKVGPLYGFTDLYMVTALSASSTKPAAQQVSYNMRNSTHSQQEPQHYGSATLPAIPTPRGKDV